MVVVTQIASYIELGYLDPFWLIASLTGFFMASIVALIVGLPFRIKRSIEREDI
jgi:presenilin-like A22 family membrane protease